MRGGDKFGEVALRQNKIRRTASVVCWENRVEILTLGSKLYNRILANLDDA